MEAIETQRRALQRASALLACLHVAALYDEEIDAGDGAYVVRGLVDGAMDALDRLEIGRITGRHRSRPP